MDIYNPPIVFLSAYLIVRSIDPINICYLILPFEPTLKCYTQHHEEFERIIEGYMVEILLDVEQSDMQVPNCPNATVPSCSLSPA